MSQLALIDPAAVGARLYNDAILVNTLGTVPMRLGAQWRASRKMGRHHQYVLTFVKGDPRKATAALPPRCPSLPHPPGQPGPASGEAPTPHRVSRFDSGRDHQGARTAH
ncbi:MULTISPECIES: hypothetical protein [Streptomyces]|uniref:hypothetical protein n=1 Tax=Streptomyces TaxID=1883 RepID=UPI00345B78C0